MICPNCGKEIEEGAVFCPACGMKAPEKPIYGMECTQNDHTDVVQYKAPLQTGTVAAEYKAPAEYPHEPAAKKGREKEYFGGGALALCLVVIGILAVSTGVFASLYFSAIGAI